MEADLPLGIRISDTEYKIPVSELSNLENILSQYKTYFNQRDVSIKEEFITICVCNN